MNIQIPKLTPEQKKRAGQFIFLMGAIPLGLTALICALVLAYLVIVKAPWLALVIILGTCLLVGAYLMGWIEEE